MTESRLQKALAALVAAALVFVSPGLGCYEALAQTAPVPLATAGQGMTPGLPVGVTDGGGVDATASMPGLEVLGDLGAIQSIGSLRSGRNAVFSLGATGSRRAVSASSARLSDAGRKVDAALGRGSQGAVSGVEAESGRADEAFRALVGSKGASRSELSVGESVEVSLDYTLGVSRPLYSAPEKQEPAEVSTTPKNDEPPPAPKKSGDLFGKLVASVLLGGIPAYFFSYPMVSSLLEAGTLASMAAVPGVLFAATNLMLAVMPLMSEKWPSFLRKAPGALLMASGIMLVMTGLGGFWTGTAYGVTTAAASWGLMRAAVDKPDQYGGHWKLFFAYGGGMAALMGMGVTMMGMTGLIPNILLGAGALGILEMAAHAPGGFRKVWASAALLPIAFLAAPMAAYGVLPVALAVSLTSLAAVAPMFMTLKTGAFKRSAATMLMIGTGIMAYLFALAPATAILTILSAVGMSAHLSERRAEHIKNGYKDDKYLLDGGEAFALGLTMLAMVTSSWLAVAAVEGLLVSALTYGSYFFGTVLLVTRIHKTIEGAVEAVGYGIARSGKRFAKGLLQWMEGSTIIENLREYTSSKLKDSWWNFWVLGAWVPLGVLAIGQFVGAIGLALAATALRGPALVLWGASQKMGWLKLQKFFAAYANATYKLMEETEATLLKKMVGKKLIEMLNTKGFFAPAAGVVATSLVSLAWAVVVAAAALVSPLVGLYKAFTADKNGKENPEDDAFDD